MKTTIFLLAVLCLVCVSIAQIHQVGQGGQAGVGQGGQDGQDDQDGADQGDQDGQDDQAGVGQGDQDGQDDQDGADQGDQDGQDGPVVPVVQQNPAGPKNTAGPQNGHRTTKIIPSFGDTNQSYIESLVKIALIHTFGPSEDEVIKRYNTTLHKKLEECTNIWMKDEIRQFGGWNAYENAILILKNAALKLMDYSDCVRNISFDCICNNTLNNTELVLHYNYNHSFANFSHLDNITRISNHVFDLLDLRNIPSLDNLKESYEKVKIKIDDCEIKLRDVFNIQANDPEQPTPEELQQLKKAAQAYNKCMENKRFDCTCD